MRRENISATQSFRILERLVFGAVDSEGQYRGVIWVENEAQCRECESGSRVRVGIDKRTESSRQLGVPFHKFSL